MRLQLKGFKSTHNCKHFYMCMTYLIHFTHIPSNKRLYRHTYTLAFNLTTREKHNFTYIPYTTIQRHMTSLTHTGLHSNTSQTCTYTYLQFKHFKTHNFIYIPRLSFKHFTDMYILMPSVQTLQKHACRV